jgi:hypothetical protein
MGANMKSSFKEQDAHMAEQKKPLGRVIGLMAFAPWILFGVASGFNHWYFASGAG